VILSLHTRFGYLALVASLVAGGLGAPVPEEIVQLTAGYLARRGIFDFVPALLCTYAGIVAGDVLFFRLAQRHGDRLLARPRIQRLLTAERRAFFDRHFARHAFLTIVVARHTSGFRLAAYALAATHGVRTRTFALADALSALLSVPLVVSLGYLFAAHLEDVKRKVHGVELGLGAAVLAGLALWAGVRWWRARPAPAHP
jgi:membrane protein DedA with SNARE-associated domain